MQSLKLNSKKIDINSMRFCELCDNYLFVTTEGDKLVYKCRKDGITIPVDPKSAEEALILETHFRTDSQSQKSKQSFMNEFTRADPTMPHLHNVKCPNTGCASNGVEAKQKDIIYVKTDVKNLLFEYQCQVCNKQWKT